MSSIIDVTQETFRSTVVESEKPVVVDFWAQWCGPCRKLGPMLEELAQEFGEDVTFAKVDVDAERTLGAMFQIMSIPAIKIFKGGEVVDEFVGVPPLDDIRQRINAQL